VTSGNDSRLVSVDEEHPTRAALDTDARQAGLTRELAAALGRFDAKVARVLGFARSIGFDDDDCALVEAELHGYEPAPSSIVVLDDEDGDVVYEREVEWLRERAADLVWKLGEQRARAQGRAFARRARRWGRSRTLRAVADRTFAEPGAHPLDVEEIVAGMPFRREALESARVESRRLAWEHKRLAGTARVGPARRRQPGERRGVRSSSRRARSPGRLADDDPDLGPASSRLLPSGSRRPAG